MSEAVAKATRRDLRRAVGTVAVDAITEQGRQIAKHALSLAEVTEQLSQHRTRLDTHDRHIYAHDVILMALTFPERLRWLLTGRV